MNREEISGCQKDRGAGDRQGGVVDTQGNLDDLGGERSSVFTMMSTLFMEFYYGFLRWNCGRREGKSGNWREDICLC